MNEIKKKLEFNDLLTDSGPFNEAEILAVLHPIIRIQKETKKIYFIEKKDLTAMQIVISYILAKQLMKQNDLVEDGNKVTSQELSNETGLKKGTVEPTIKNLKDRGLLIGKGEYEIPISNLDKVLGVINGK